MSNKVHKYLKKSSTNYFLLKISPDCFTYERLDYTQPRKSKDYGQYHLLISWSFYLSFIVIGQFLIFDSYITQFGGSLIFLHPSLLFKKKFCFPPYLKLFPLPLHENESCILHATLFKQASRLW